MAKARKVNPERKRARFSKEFKVEAVRLLELGQKPAAALCRALRVSRSGFYTWQTRPESARRVRDRQLLPVIARVHAEAREAYGARKTWVALNQAGIACGKHRVARLRCEAGIEAKRK